MIFSERRDGCAAVYYPTWRPNLRSRLSDPKRTSSGGGSCEASGCSWARFLEQVNDDNALIRVINKLELATPKREDLSVYREILRREFEEDTCFYCGKKLQKVIHVDHFIPWSFVKDDKIWNFVLSCPTCNEKKNNRVPGKDYLIRIEDRNKKIQLLNNTVIQTDFAGYSDDLIGRMWSYAKLSGIKEYRG